jgi:hypothetical protein
VPPTTTLLKKLHFDPQTHGSLNYAISDLLCDRLAATVVACSLQNVVAYFSSIMPASRAVKLNAPKWLNLTSWFSSQAADWLMMVAFVI